MAHSIFDHYADVFQTASLKHIISSVSGGVYEIQSVFNEQVDYFFKPTNASLKFTYIHKCHSNNELSVRDPICICDLSG